MLIRDCIWLVEVLVSLFSIPVLIYAIENKDKNKYKKIKWVSFICIGYILYLFLFLRLQNIYYVPYRLDVIAIWFLMFIAIILYIVALVINKMKQKKLKETNTNKSKLVIIALSLTIMAELFIRVNVIQDKQLIKNSELILIFSSGNNTFGSADVFAYAIRENSCEQFDLGIGIGSYYLKKFAPKNLEIREINRDSYDKNFKIIENGDIEIYRNNKLICKKKNTHNYHNIEIKKGFYISHN